MKISLCYVLLLVVGLSGLSYADEVIDNTRLLPIKMEREAGSYFSSKSYSKAKSSFTTLVSDYPKSKYSNKAKQYIERINASVG